jgi:hypothetical protein
VLCTSAAKADAIRAVDKPHSRVVAWVGPAERVHKRQQVITKVRRQWSGKSRWTHASQQRSEDIGTIVTMLVKVLSMVIMEGT